MNYFEFSIQDFVMDQYFIQWVRDPDSTSDLFWKNWLKENPEKKEVIEKARIMVQSINYEKYYPTQEVLDQDWVRLDTSIQQLEEQRIQQESNENNKNISIPLSKTHWGKIAAAFIGILMVSGLVYLSKLKFSTRSEYTLSAETRTIALPDHSVVTLNANSRVRFSLNWEEQTIREVWLEGEGFFSVVHKKNNQPFIVHTDVLNVEVLGTKFDVSSRRGKTTIVLESGKVKVNTDQAEELGHVYMKPGELIEYSNGQNEFQKRKVKVDNYLAWKDKLLIFDSTPVLQVAQILEDNFGITIEIRDKHVKTLTFSGSFPSDNKQLVLKAFARSFNFKIIEKGKKVIFKGRY